MNTKTQLLHLESKLDLILEMLKITDSDVVYLGRHAAHKWYLEEPNEDE